MPALLIAVILHYQVDILWNILSCKLWNIFTLLLCCISIQRNDIEWYFGHKLVVLIQFKLKRNGKNGAKTVKKIIFW